MRSACLPRRPAAAYLCLVRRDRINSGITNEVSPRYFVTGAMIASPNMGQSHPTPSLLGTWRLTSFEARDSKGQLQYPLGERVSGLLIYDAGGNMSAHVMRDDRPRFVANDPGRGTDAEVRAAFEGHTSYFGTYTIDLATQNCNPSCSGCVVPELDGQRSAPLFQVRGLSPVALHASARIRWRIIGVRCDLGTHLVRAEAGVKSVAA
jgi:Lipocalin-like domain